ncbi:hypothetical protein HOLleu_20549 [Holothuria leucospilota]|uniref:Reverse transcriptase domain-containing protein n=1 Tax=Holothuria leucospilota TaxID=206669 RepID=A0A9Q1C0X5_HOLLE|nr:hypothetical protein HOLleu_20549 [Holothuria leucospilota]
MIRNTASPGPKGRSWNHLGTVCTHPVGKIIRSNNIGYLINADDTQMYVTFDPKIPGACNDALCKLQSCIKQIKDWMVVNRLQLNQSKTGFFISGSSRSISRLNTVILDLGDVQITPATSLRNLGLMFDTCLPMTDPMSSIVKLC